MIKPIARSAPKYQPPTADSERRILLLAADPELRGHVSILRSAGFHAEVESDAETAWQALGRDGYELVVLEQHLPGGSGLRFVLRMNHANLTLPVILVTEACSDFDPLTHSRLRSITVLSRPFNGEQLLEIVLVTLPNDKPAPAVQNRQYFIEAPKKKTRKRVAVGARR